MILQKEMYLYNKIKMKKIKKYFFFFIFFELIKNHDGEIMDTQHKIVYWTVIILSILFFYNFILSIYYSIIETFLSD